MDLNDVVCNVFEFKVLFSVDKIMYESQVWMYVRVMEKDISDFKESYIEKVLKYIIDVFNLLK